MRLLVMAALSLPAAASADPPGREEVQARESFLLGDYQVALERYLLLYGETFHPIHLRNVGRCYQMMGQSSKAVTVFREYLELPRLAAEDRLSVQGYIREMEALQRRQKADTPAVQLALPRPARVSPPPARPEPPPLYRRWWLWAIAGGAIAAGASAAILSAPRP